MLEDLQESDSGGQHRFLMKSDTVVEEPVTDGLYQHSSLHPTYSPHSHFSHERHIPQFISTSCPEFWQHCPPVSAPSSLPTELKMEKPYFKALHRPDIHPPKYFSGK